MKRRWPVHPITALILLLAAGTLVWVNLQGANVSIDMLTNEPKIIYGWPSVAVERYSAFYMMSDRDSFFPDWTAIASNVLCAGVILALIGIACEFLLRGPRRFQIHLSTALLLMLTAGALGWVNTTVIVRSEFRIDYVAIANEDVPIRPGEIRIYNPGLGNHMELDNFVVKIFSKGWPYGYSVAEYPQLSPPQVATMKQYIDDERFHFKPYMLALNLAFALLILCMAAILSEALIRRGFSVLPLFRTLRLRARSIVYWAIHCFIADVSLEQGERKSSSDV